MTEPLRLVVFDVDGTLVDSRVHILGSMQQAFEDLGLPVPSDTDILHGVGLSLPELMAQLVPHETRETHLRLSHRYKEISLHRHGSTGRDAKPAFFPGMRDLLDALRADDFTLLATATGMSRRGLDRVIDQNGLSGYFQSTQVADNHPSKPHPSMLEAALSETGVLASQAIMVGDTAYDIAMGQAASTSTIGVTWGNHPRDHLLQADVIVDTAADLHSAIKTWMETLK